uniref:Uncharacterized protein n=1 Tax=Trypanosoma vivax (strain Y486) TaxID=1055687 RepID=G0U180_TRYVY|nr:conserved hypothetical protein, fragment [Trypanosoma vivax Y486]
MYRRVTRLFSPIDELVVTGSRWSRILTMPVKPSAAGGIDGDMGVPTVSASATLSTPFMTFIPTLHVASVEFYDKVLDYMKRAVDERKNVVILLEGLCDNEEGEVQQMEEYFQISRNEELRESMIEKADKNTLFSEELMKTICEELAVRYDVLSKEWATIRLQECYLRPKMAAMVGENLRNDADLNMREVEALLLGDIEYACSMQAVRGLVESGVTGEVILPWGFYHTEGIRRDVLSMNSQEEGIVFVESDDIICRIPFGIHKELLA